MDKKFDILNPVQMPTALPLDQRKPFLAQLSEQV